MIGRKRAILRGERRPLLVGQLLGMEPDAQAMVGGGLEQPLDLFRSESYRIAKSVDAGGQTRLRGLRDELVDDLTDIMRAAVFLLGGKRVEREQSGDNAHRFVLA